MPKDTKNNGWELKTSLRSVYENCKFDFDITIIGEIPDWINQNEINFIPSNQRRTDCQRETKMNLSLLTVAEIYDEFLLFNDDFIVMQETGSFVFKNAYMIGQTNIIEANEFKKGSYKEQMRRTALALKEKDLDYKTNYSAHVPRFYNSNVLRALNQEINIAPMGDWSIILNTAYYSFLKAEKIAINANTIRYGVWGEKAEKYNNELIINFDENGINKNPNLKKSLEEIFDKKCKAEI